MPQASVPVLNSFNTSTKKTKKYYIYALQIFALLRKKTGDEKKIILKKNRYQQYRLEYI